VEKNVSRLYVVNVLASAQFHLVVYTLFLLSKGFSNRQFFLIESAYALVSLLMEIPTGVISDTKSRKWSLVAASVIGLIGTPVIILSDSFFIVLIAMAIGGISAALVSGTDTAILYDTLKALDREDDFKRVSGKMGWYTSLSMAVAGIIGGLIAQVDMAYAWWAYAGAGVLALLAKLTLREPPLSQEASEHESYWQHLGKSLELSLTGDAGYFVFYAAVIWLFFSLGFWLWQPYLELSGVPIAWFGVIYAAQNLVGGYAAKQAHRVERKFGTRNSLLSIPLLLAAAFVLESQFVFVLGFAFILLQSIASGCFGPLLADYINKRIPSSTRATVLSIKNMMNSILFMTISPLLGHSVDLYSLPTALLLMGVVLTITALAFFVAYGSMHQGRDELAGAVEQAAERSSILHKEP